MAFGQGPPRLGKQSKPSADQRPARPRRSRAAAGRGRVFQGGSRASARRGPVLGPPTSSADWRPAWVRRSRAAEGRSSAFQGGSRASAGRGPVLGPPRPSADRCPAWPRSSTAGPWGGCQPSLRRQPPPPSWSGGSSRRRLAHPGDSGGPAASFPPGPAAPALAEGGGPGPAPAPPGFAGGGLAGWPWQPGCSRTDHRKPRGARWQTPAGHCRQRPGWAPGVGPGSSPRLRPSCCVLIVRRGAGVSRAPCSGAWGGPAGAQATPSPVLVLFSRRKHQPTQNLCLWQFSSGEAAWGPSRFCKNDFSCFSGFPMELRAGAERPWSAHAPGWGLPCLRLHFRTHSGCLSLGMPGLEGAWLAFGLSSGRLAWGFCRGARHWRVLRCPGRRSWPAASPAPGSCPSAAPAVDCSPWAAVRAPAPGGSSPSRAHGEMCLTRGLPRSQRGGPMTLSCPHPWAPRPLTTPDGCRRSLGGRAPRGSQTRPLGEVPAGRLPPGRAGATSGQT